MLRIEFALILAALIFAFAAPEIGSVAFARAERYFSKLGRKRFVSVALVGCLALLLRVLLVPVLPIPEPVIHDEFGYLLAADTFSHGRITNATHPLWMHFETFNEIQKPTYQSYTQPGQGLALAFGKVLFGRAFWGVWLSTGAMCAGICWMLQAWLPARWGLLGGLLAVAHFGVFSYWANSYWGGALPALGGALVLGALPRIQRSKLATDSVVMGTGLAILANTRPYEGLIFSTPVLLVLLFWMVRSWKGNYRVIALRVIMPMTLVLALTFVAMGYYFWRVTGNPFRMPYSVERQTYAVAPYFLWQQPRPRPTYHDPVVEKMYSVDEMNGYRLFRSPAGVMVKLFWSWRFYLGLLLSLPLVMLLFALPYGFSWKDARRNTRFLLTVLAISVLGLLVESFYAPHYPAPITGLLLLVVLIAMRQLCGWRPRHRPTGLFLVRAIPVLAVLMFTLRGVAGALHIPLQRFYAPAWYQEGPAPFGRQEIERELRKLPGKHLVIVQYSASHDPFEEWVYNCADIDNSEIVWARDLGHVRDEDLLQYFSHRQVWQLRADEVPPKLESRRGDPDQ